MISYAPLWETMNRKNITTYKLIYDFEMSSALINKLKNNRNVTMETIERLCHLLECDVEDIVKIT